MKFAVIKTGGKQYLVQEGQTLSVEKIAGEAGAKIKFPALLMAEEEKIEIGQPLVKGEVAGEIVKQYRGKKIVVVKYKPKVRYHKTQGHRQELTQVKIVKI